MNEANRGRERQRWEWEMGNGNDKNTYTFYQGTPYKCVAAKAQQHTLMKTHLFKNKKFSFENSAACECARWTRPTIAKRTNIFHFSSHLKYETAFTSSAPASSLTLLCLFSNSIYDVANIARIYSDFDEIFVLCAAPINKLTIWERKKILLDFLQQMRLLQMQTYSYKNRI